MITAHSLEPLRPWKAAEIGALGYLLSSWMERTGYEGADQIIAVSNAMRDDILESYPAVDPDRVQVVTNGIDVDEYRPIHDTAALQAALAELKVSIDLDRPLVLFIGRTSEQKGIEHLLAAAGQFSPDAQLLLIAPGDPNSPLLTARVNAAIAALRQAGRVVIHIDGIWNDLVKIMLLSHALVFVVPSIYEPLGIVNLEAMATGTAVVGSRVGGIPDVVEDGVTGLLVDFDPNDPQGFRAGIAAAVNALLAAPDRARAMGANGRRNAIGHFTWAHTAAGTLAVYRATGSTVAMAPLGAEHVDPASLAPALHHAREYTPRERLALADRLDTESNRRDTASAQLAAELGVSGLLTGIVELLRGQTTPAQLAGCCSTAQPRGPPIRKVVLRHLDRPLTVPGSPLPFHALSARSGDTLTVYLHAPHAPRGLVHEITEGLLGRTHELATWAEAILGDLQPGYRLLTTARHDELARLESLDHERATLDAMLAGLGRDGPLRREWAAELGRAVDTIQQEGPGRDEIDKRPTRKLWGPSSLTRTAAWMSHTGTDLTPLAGPAPGVAYLAGSRHRPRAPPVASTTVGAPGRSGEHCSPYGGCTAGPLRRAVRLAGRLLVVGGLTAALSLGPLAASGEAQPRGALVTTPAASALTVEPAGPPGTGPTHTGRTPRPTPAPTPTPTDDQIGRYRSDGQIARYVLLGVAALILIALVTVKVKHGPTVPEDISRYVRDRLALWLYAAFVAGIGVQELGKHVHWLHAVATSAWLGPPTALVLAFLLATAARLVRTQPGRWPLWARTAVGKLAADPLRAWLLLGRLFAVTSGLWIGILFAGFLDAYLDAAGQASGEPDRARVEAAAIFAAPPGSLGGLYPGWVADVTARLPARRIPATRPSPPAAGPPPQSPGQADNWHVTTEEP